MSERWYKEAVVYSVEVDSFQDSNGDGCGDLPVGLPCAASGSCWILS